MHSANSSALCERICMLAFAHCEHNKAKVAFAYAMWSGALKIGQNSIYRRLIQRSLSDVER